jgi:hypothetical protein
MLSLELTYWAVVREELIRAFGMDGVRLARLLSPDQIARGATVEIILRRKKPIFDEGIHPSLLGFGAAGIARQKPRGLVA